MANNCILKCNGTLYGGWKEIQIQRGIEQIAGQYSIAVTDRWSGQDTARPIEPGDKCEVAIDGETILTGYIDATDDSYDANNTSLQVNGRDKTADLIDCSAVFKTGQWKGGSLKKLATDLLAPFGIELIIGQYAEKAANEVITSFNIEEGETVFDCLERACRIKAVMMWTNGLGQLIIDLPGKQRCETALVEGENILSAQRTRDASERFSEYTVKGQARGKSNGSGKATDEEVGRHRPMIILAEDMAAGQTPEQRAKWEASVRAGKGERVSVRVQSWRQGGDAGALWAPGFLVQITSPRLELDDEMTIVSVNYIKNDSDGTVTELELTDPDAFELLSVDKRKKPKKGKKKGKGKKKKDEGVE